jgi:hypothetical protein
MKSRSVFVVLCALVGLAGCGLQAYEERLEATRSYWAYLDKLDQNLRPPWKTPPVESLRVPLQFNELPAPQPVEGPDGEQELPDVDPRQPDYVSLSIPGLIGAWKADVDANVNGERATQAAYLYAATNHQMLLTDASEAAAFSPNLIAAVEAALGSPAPESPAPLPFPKGHQFTPKISFDVHPISSQDAIRGSRYIFEIYTTRQLDNQVAIIFASPEGLDPQSKIPERIQLMLESLRVSAAPPTPTQPGQGSTPGAPQQPGGNF